MIRSISPVSETWIASNGSQFVAGANDYNSYNGQGQDGFYWSSDGKTWNDAGPLNDSRTIHPKVDDFERGHTQFYFQVLVCVQPLLQEKRPRDIIVDGRSKRVSENRDSKLPLGFGYRVVVGGNMPQIIHSKFVGLEHFI